MVTHNVHKQYTGFLGNIMFQVASTIGIAKKNDIIYQFSDFDLFNHFDGEFNVNHYLGTLPYKTIEENGFHYQDIVIEDKSKDYNLMGYYQSEKYFTHCKSLIKKLFTFKLEVRNSCFIEYQKALKEANAKGKQLCAIHFRFGDYLNLKEYHTCLIDTPYYQKAIEEMGYDMEYYVFSDNLQLASGFMAKRGVNFTLSNGINSENTTYTDLCLMSLFNNIIIANSTFSWWGAWLGSDDKKVVSPSANHWFGEQNKRIYDAKDVIPMRWRKIEW